MQASLSELTVEEKSSMNADEDRAVEVTLRRSDLLECPDRSVGIRHLLTVSTDIDGSPSGIYNDDSVSSLLT